MARKGLHSRKRKYRAHATQAVKNIDLWLVRIRERLECGHLCNLSAEEKVETRKLLAQALDHKVNVVGGKIVSITRPVFKDRRKIYFMILKILRQAGNRSPDKKSNSTKPILRKNCG